MIVEKRRPGTRYTPPLEHPNRADLSCMKRAATDSLLDFPTSFSRSDGIDLLRGLLALWVMFAHLVPWAGMTSGIDPALQFFMTGLGRVFQPMAETHPAVLGFIVLSGYCIHRNGFRRSEGHLQAYAIRRFFRIIPVYLLASLAGVAAFLAASALDPRAAAALSGTTEITTRCLAVKLTGISVLLPRFHECSFEGNAPLTTVMVEIWLYALYAIAVFVLLRHGKERVFWSWLIPLWALGTVYAYRHPDLLSWWHNGSLLGFAVYWWLGAKFVSPDFCTSIKRWRWLIALGWLALTACLLFKVPDWALLVEVRKLFFAALIGSLIAEIDAMRLQFTRPATGIGRAGYSLYAFHAPLLIYLLLSGLHWSLVAALTISTSLVAYAAFEAPLTRLGKRLSAPPQATA